MVNKVHQGTFPTSLYIRSDPRFSGLRFRIHSQIW